MRSIGGTFAVLFFASAVRNTLEAEEQFDQTIDRLLLDRKIITDPDSYGYEKDQAKFDALTTIRAWLNLACPEATANGLAMKPMDLWLILPGKRGPAGVLQQGEHNRNGNNTKQIRQAV